MYVPFNDMPGDARIWIYQADRPFAATERAAIENEMVHMCQEWSAHGTPLRSSFRIEYSLFVILAVDERAAGASGCSIDGTVRLLKDLQKRLGLDFFNRQVVATLEGTTLRLHLASSLKTVFDSGALMPESVTFDNTLTTKADWEQRWQVMAKNSWLARFLPKPAGA